MLKIDIDGITADELLRMALIGLEQTHKEQELRMEALQARLGGKVTTGSRTTAVPPEKKAHRMSPEARARIVAAQKKRWANVRKELKQKGQVAGVVTGRKRGRPRLTEQAVA